MPQFEATHFIWKAPTLRGGGEAASMHGSRDNMCAITARLKTCLAHGNPNRLQQMHLVSFVLQFKGQLYRRRSRGTDSTGRIGQGKPL